MSMVSQLHTAIAHLGAFKSEIAAGFVTVLLIWFLPGLLRKVRILWGLRNMQTAPQSLGVLFLGHTFALARAVWRRPSTWDLFCTWAQATGPAPTRVQIFDEQCAVIADPALMKRVLQTNLKNYQKDVDFSYKPFMGILGSGLVTSEGELWAKQRKMVSNAFRIEILDDIVGIAHRATQRLCAKLERLRGTGQAAEMSEEFRHLALQVIGEAILSLAPEESDRVFPKLYLPIMTESNRCSLEPWRAAVPWLARRQARRVRELNDYIIGMLRARWAQRLAAGGEQHTDIVGRVMGALQPHEWGPAAETQLCYEIKTFLLAGHETSAAMLTWALYELTQNAGHLARLRSECKGVLSPEGPLPSRASLEQLPWTVAVLKEALRLYSVVPVVTRVAVGDDTLGGRAVPAGTRIILSLQGVHHRADLWPEPLAFRPERFLEADASGDGYGYKFLAFVAGPRNCLGQHLALLEARIVLGTLATHFDFECAPGERGQKDTKMIPISPELGMRMIVK